MARFELEQDVKHVLRDIMQFIGVDKKWAEYAQLQSYLEDLVKRHR